MDAAIVGRKEAMIISGGENAQSVKAEEALNQHPKVSGWVATGVTVFRYTLHT